MRITKLNIKNLFGITETELDGSSVELTGANGTGKTSVIDAIKYALTNSSDRDVVVRNGEKEGEILIETDTGLSIQRKKRTTMSDYKKVTENEVPVQTPESFLQSLFTPLQLNPVEFISLPKNEQNRMVLDLIDFHWDLNWIREQFGEIPEGIDYSRNILQVLSDIQSENGAYYQRRQDINRDIRNRRAFIGEIASSIPEHFDAERWDSYDLSEMYKKINDMERLNNQILRAKDYVKTFDDKIRGIVADGEIAKSGIEQKYALKRSALDKEIAEAEKKIALAKKEIEEMTEKIALEKSVIDADTEAKKTAKMSDLDTATEYSAMDIIDISDIKEEVKLAEEMKKHLIEYNRMKTMQSELEDMERRSEDLTNKIELARNLPGEILKTANIPVEGLTVEDGIPLVNGLPISNLSEGEKLQLCIDIAVAKPNALQLILLDGTEKLSEENRIALYEKCRENGLQFIATRTTDANILEVTTL